MLGRVQAGCEIRELPGEGGRRHHYFVGVIRDLAGNVWVCEDRHSDQDTAHQCAQAEFSRRVEAGLIRSGRARQG